MMDSMISTAMMSFTQKGLSIQDVLLYKSLTKDLNRAIGEQNSLLLLVRLQK